MPVGEVREEVGDDPAGPLLEGLHAVQLAREESFQLWREVDHAPVVVLGRAGLEAKGRSIS